MMKEFLSCQGLSWHRGRAIGARHTSALPLQPRVSHVAKILLARHPLYCSAAPTDASLFAYVTRNLTKALSPHKSSRTCIDCAMHAHFRRSTGFCVLCHLDSNYSSSSTVTGSWRTGSFREVTLNNPSPFIRKSNQHFPCTSRIFGSVNHYLRGTILISGITLLYRLQNPESVQITQISQFPVEPS